jgi:riboflavin kinase
MRKLRNPYFKGVKKSVEPWLLHHFSADFYGQELRMVVVGYIRPEADFTTLDALVRRRRRCVHVCCCRADGAACVSGRQIAQIHGDADVARAALELQPYAALRHDAFLRPPAAA